MQHSFLSKWGKTTLFLGGGTGSGWCSHRCCQTTDSWSSTLSELFMSNWHIHLGPGNNNLWQLSSTACEIINWSSCHWDKDTWLWKYLELLLIKNVCLTAGHEVDTSFFLLVILQHSNSSKNIVTFNRISF